MKIRGRVLAACVAAFSMSLAGVAQARPLAVTVDADTYESCWESGLTGTGSCGAFATADAGGTSVAEAFVESDADGSVAGSGNAMALDRFYGRFELSGPAKSVTVTAATHVRSASAAWTAGPFAQPDETATASVLLQSFLSDSPIGCCHWGKGAADVTVVSAASDGPGETVSGRTYVLTYTIQPREGVERLPAGEYTTVVRNYALAQLGHTGNPPGEGSGTVRAALDGAVTITAESKG